MKTFNACLGRFALIVGVLLMASPLWAQQTIDSTTLTTTMTASQLFVTIGSVTCTNCTINSNTVIYIDMEAMCVNGSYTSGTTLPITRGCLGTRAAAHVSAALAVNTVVWYGPANRFHTSGGDPNAADPPQGFCGPRTQWPFLPWINVNNGREWICDNLNWRYVIPFNVNGTGPSR